MNQTNVCDKWEQKRMGATALSIRRWSSLPGASRDPDARRADGRFVRAGYGHRKFMI